MLKLKKLYITAVGRLVEEQIIDFESLGSMVQLDGLNNNTGGSSGAGKSTIFHALDFLFGLNNDIPNTELQSRLTETHMSVKGIFDYDGKPLTISRAKKLYIDEDGVITTGSSKLSEEKLDEIIAIPRHLFRPMLHKRQKEGGFFLDLTPKATNDFLMNGTGLGHFKCKIDKVDAKITELTKKKESLSGEIASARTGMEATRGSIAALGLEPAKEVDQETILSLKQKLDNAIGNLDRVRLDQKMALEELEFSRPLLAQGSYDKAAKETQESMLRSVREKKRDVQMYERNRQVKVNEWIAARKLDAADRTALIEAGEAAKKEAAKIALNIKKIRDNSCPTCEQSWITENAKTTEVALLEKLKSLKETIKSGNFGAQEMQAILADLARWDLEKIPRTPEGIIELEAEEKELEGLIALEKTRENDFQNAQHYINNLKMEQFAELQKQTTKKHSAQIDSASSQVTLDRRCLDIAVGKMRSYEEAIARYKKSLNSLNDQLLTYEEKEKERSASLEQVSAELSLSEELKRAIKSYLSCSFDDALATIGTTATAIIRSIPNMASATIQLEGIRETGEGKIKEEVNAVVHMDGDESIPIRTLCGGERSAIDLAVDLAVIDLIESKSNKGIDLFILDEPFTGLDTICIEMALEVLKNSNTNKRLIIVDHNPEVKQMVESRLLVVRDGLTSKVAQAA